MWQKIKNLFHLAQAIFAAIYFNFPSKKLTVIAVTGTDGKTTTVNMIYHILKESGHKVSAVSSLGANIDNKLTDTGLHVSTPNPYQIQKLLKDAVDAGSEYFVLEATSHGLDQNRLAFVKVEAAVLTNITDEHLDYHKNWQNYTSAKAKLFKNVKYSVLNLDDPKSYQFLKGKVGGKLMTYSVNKDTGTDFKKYPLSQSIKGAYNISNALAAFSVCVALGIPAIQIYAALKKFKGVPGRMEEIRLNQKFKALVDFAHTPNGLEQVLKTLKSQMTSKKSRLIAVFGSAGERDRAKRQKMGQIAASIADVSVLTAEDPRGERVDNISKEISKGFKIEHKVETKDYFVINDRKTAINFAVGIAKPGDILIFLGKGHEKSMNIDGIEYPWDERKEVEAAIKNKSKNEK